MKGAALLEIVSNSQDMTVAVGERIYSRPYLWPLPERDLQCRRERGLPRFRQGRHARLLPAASGGRVMPYERPGHIFLIGCAGVLLFALGYWLARSLNLCGA
jgi:hypothetical protein